MLSVDRTFQNVCIHSEKSKKKKDNAQVHLKDFLECMPSRLCRSHRRFREEAEEEAEEEEEEEVSALVPSLPLSL